MAKPERSRTRWFKRPRPVVIVWEDACSGDGWRDVAELKDFARSAHTIHSLGVLMGRTRRCWILAGDICSHNATQGRLLKVPRSWVVRIRKLPWPKEKKR